ncbi:hypothetical protein [Streptomyces sp. NPDC002851]
MRTHVFLRPWSGTVAQGRGYDRETGIWIEPALEHKPVSDDPTGAELRHARAVVGDYFRGWNFRARSDRSAMLAAHMDAPLRAYVGGMAPGVLAVAPTMASGKTYGAECLAEMFGGRINSARQELRSARQAADDDARQVRVPRGACAG